MQQFIVTLRQLCGFGGGRIVGFHFEAASLLVGCTVVVLALLGGLLFARRLYRREDAGGASFNGRLLGGLRTAALVFAVLVLLRPTLTTEAPTVDRQRALVLLDTSRSMGTVDDEKRDEGTGNEPRNRDAAQEEHETDDGEESKQPAAAATRWAQARAALDEALDELADTYQLDCYTFDEQPEPLLAEDSDSARAGSSGALVDRIREGLERTKPEGNRTALGDALSHVLRLAPPPSVVLIFSDGVNNWGQNVNASARLAREMGVRLLVVATGGEGKQDVSIARLDVPDVVPVGEETNIKVHVQQNGYTDQTVTVELRQEDAVLERRDVRLTRRLVDVAMSFTGRETGEYQYTVQVLPLNGESSEENNSRVHKAKVVDHKPQVLLVEQRPRWEWRFALAALLRDKRVGGRVKAYLSEQDRVPPGQDQARSLFVDSYPDDLEALSRYDTVVLGDLPRDGLSEAQMEATRRFVRDRGGGLIVLGGPDHAPREYFGTPIGEMMPLVEVVDAPPAGPFAVHATPTSFGRALLQPHDDPDADSSKRLRFPGLHRCFSGTADPRADILAVRASGAAAGPPLPVVLTRRYGRGRVLYVGTDDLWRLRGLVGSQWHDRFWVQAVIQTGMQKILGGDAHLELHPAKRVYFPGELVEIEGTAFAQDFSPSKAKSIDVKIRGTAEGNPVGQGTLHVLDDRGGQFAGTLPAPDREGSYLLSATDPVSKEDVELCFQVAATGPELEYTRTDRDLLQQLAALSGGEFCEPADLGEYLQELKSDQIKTLATMQVPVWDTWPLFLLFIGALTLEWWLRKRANLL